MVFYRFFGGKGGVGKTTCAAAFAVASARAGRRTLLISTDPAPSAGDTLRQPLTASPRVVKGTRGRLHGLEVNAASALERWLAPQRATLEAIVLRGTWLDADDVGRLLRLSLPGIDEIAALLETSRLGRSGRYELLVVDTAPTGHTLRMLAMPELLSTLAAVFDRMQDKHRAIVEALRGRWTPEEADVLIGRLHDEGRELAALVRDEQRTAMTWVTLPEPMAVAESGDALDQLRRLGVRTDTIVINRLTPAPDRLCRWCSARRAFEQVAVNRLLAGADHTARIATIQARGNEPRGIGALAAIAAEMDAPPALRRIKGKGVRAVTALPIPRGRSAPLPADHVSLLMFGGKGGVGKTTCAAAAAVTAAARWPKRRVLLVSADPAHSLADVLGTPLGDEPRRISGAPANLQARELDSTAHFESVKNQYATAIDALFNRLGLVHGSPLSASADRQAMRDLMQLAPPGLDELMAMVEVSNALESTLENRSASASPERTPDRVSRTADTLVVLDTAPSGHALRLLEMPAIVHDWVKALMGILLKYQPITGVGELGALLLRMSQGLGRLRALLVDPSKAAFVAVTQPAALPAGETVRLIRRLQTLGISVPAVAVNAVGAGTCSRCAAERRLQQRALASIRKTVAGRGKSRVVVIAPAVMPPPHGPRHLAEWRKTWRVQGSKVLRF